MLEKFELEKANNQHFKDCVELFNHYLYRQIETNNPKLARDLEQKLLDGNRNFILSYASECKNKIHRKIVRNSLYKSSHDVFIFILSTIYNNFSAMIKSKICSNQFQEHEIDELINRNIIKPIWEDCQLYSLIDDEGDLFGLLYLLAGNCHIDWDNEV